MTAIKPNELRNLDEVAHYWAACLARLENTDDKQIASSMVGVISNEHDEKWRQISPAYAHIFELASDLELPDGSPEWRNEAWASIVSLMGILDRDYSSRT